MTDNLSESRRAFLTRTGVLAAAPLAFAAPPAADPWRNMNEILARIKAPDFPAKDFDITKFGATGDGATDCTQAIAKAVAACAAAGGGRVVVPAGRFLTGAIHLKSNVNLHVSGGATLLFSREPGHYMPVVFTRWEGMECMNFSPFIYAFEQKNVAITGAGTLDGQSDCAHWWPWKGRTNCGWKKGDVNQAKDRDALIAACEKDVPVKDRVFGEGHYLRPQFIQPYRCANVLIEGVTIRNSPMWEINPVLCSNVTVRGVTIVSHGPNNDGCNPESCTDVLIEKCQFDTGDDCIAIKSGRNRDGRRVAAACENVIVRDCAMKDGHGGVTIGSEVSGNVRNVYVENCTMDSPNLDRALRIKTNSYRGGIVENVFMRKVTIGQVAEAVVHVDFFYEEGEGGAHQPTVRNIEVADVTCKKSRYALYLRGFKSSPITQIKLMRCTFDGVAKSNVAENVQGIELIDVKMNSAPLSTV
jgi:polygalacturonase